MNLLRHSYLKIILMTTVAFVVVSACDPEDPEEDPSPQELAFEKLEGNWSLDNGRGSILLDKIDLSPNYPGFSLNFSDGTYTSQNGTDLFRASGTWEWLGDEAEVILFDDGKELNIEELTEGRFTFGFFLADGGVRAGLPGNYIISLVK